jgi:hypothetical protein
MTVDRAAITAVQMCRYWGFMRLSLMQLTILREGVGSCLRCVRYGVLLKKAHIISRNIGHVLKKLSKYALHVDENLNTQKKSRHNHPIYIDNRSHVNLSIT